jgi:hypothetical protein
VTVPDFAVAAIRHRGSLAEERAVYVSIDIDVLDYRKFPAAHPLRQWDHQRAGPDAVRDRQEPGSDRPIWLR